MNGADRPHGTLVVLLQAELLRLGHSTKKFVTRGNTGAGRYRPLQNAFLPDINRLRSTPIFFSTGLRRRNGGDDASQGQHGSRSRVGKPSEYEISANRRGRRRRPEESQRQASRRHP